MITEIPKILSKKITDKYNIVRNVFIVKDKKELHNEFEVEVGDLKQDDFFPQLKIKRWDNECNFSCRLVDDDLDTPQIKTENNKIRFIKNRLEAHFYEDKLQQDKKEIDAYEFEVVLKERPKTNKIQMSIETKGLEFFYQPSLIKEYKIGDQKGKVVEVTDTEVKDKDGKVICYRPENIVGSYAVYHFKNQGDYSKIGGKNYRAGKAFHIYRPKIIDQAGNWVWGKLNIDVKNKLLAVEIPQEFLDKAVYPVRVDPTFGYTTLGTSENVGLFAANYAYFNRWASPAAISGEVINKMSFGGRYFSDPDNIKCVIYINGYDGDEPTPIANAIGAAVALPAVKGWVDSAFSVSPSLANSTNYLLAVVSQDSGTPAYDSGLEYYEGACSYANPGLVALAEQVSYKFSLYVTYGVVPTVLSPNYTKEDNYSGYLAFVQQYIKHRLNDTTPWASPDGYMIE